MRQPYRLLTVGFLACAAAATAGALVLLHGSNTVDASAEVGKWLLTVAAGLVLTGALSMVAKQIDQRRTEREAWRAVLHDLVAANQVVMLGRVRLAAHRSALTYREQLAEVMRARVELRRILAIGIVAGDRPLRDLISALRNYLDAMGREYESGYLHVARQQRLDELWLTERLKAAIDNTDMPILPALLAEPTEAWRLLQDRARFPRLAALLDNDAFPIDTFRTSYKRAKARLEVNAGYGARPIAVRVSSGRKLAKRAINFMTLHDLPDELKVPVSQQVEQLERACDNEDRRAIDEATAKLTQATSLAVSAVYPPGLGDTTAEGVQGSDHRESRDRFEPPRPTLAANSPSSQEPDAYHTGCRDS
jgi:hypothetical protein